MNISRKLHLSRLKKDLFYKAYFLIKSSELKTHIVMTVQKFGMGLKGTQVIQEDYK